MTSNLNPNIKSPAMPSLKTVNGPPIRMFRADAMSIKSIVLNIIKEEEIEKKRMRDSE